MPPSYKHTLKKGKLKKEKKKGKNPNHELCCFAYGYFK